MGDGVVGAKKQCIHQSMANKIESCTKKKAQVRELLIQVSNIISSTKVEIICVFSEPESSEKMNTSYITRSHENVFDPHLRFLKLYVSYHQCVYLTVLLFHQN